MYLSAIQDVDFMPSIGSMFGSTGNDAMLSRLSSQGGAGGVVFGHAGDPMASRYNKFRNTISNVVSNTIDKISNTYDVIMRRDKPVLLSDESGFTKIPECMKIPLLTHAPIRELLSKSEISGFGIKEEWLPEEDVVGRLISNGYVEQSMNFKTSKYEFPEYAEEIYRSDDPDFDDDQLEIINSSRKYMEQYIERQLSDDGESLDPTNFGEGAMIGTIE